MSPSTSGLSPYFVSGSLPLQGHIIKHAPSAPSRSISTSTSIPFCRSLHIFVAPCTANHFLFVAPCTYINTHVNVGILVSLLAPQPPFNMAAQPPAQQPPQIPFACTPARVSNNVLNNNNPNESTKKEPNDKRNLTLTRAMETIVQDQE